MKLMVVSQRWIQQKAVDGFIPLEKTVTTHTTLAERGLSLGEWPNSQTNVEVDDDLALGFRSPFSFRGQQTVGIYHI